LYADVRFALSRQWTLLKALTFVKHLMDDRHSLTDRDVLRDRASHWRHWMQALARASSGMHL
jgi:hypothetical protein